MGGRIGDEMQNFDVSCSNCGDVWIDFGCGYCVGWGKEGDWCVDFFGDVWFYGWVELVCVGYD